MLGRRYVNMKNEDYTHVRVSKELHVVLKREAENKGMCISDYIADLIGRIQSIEALIAGKSTVNIPVDSEKSSNKCSNWKLGADPAGFEPAIPGLEGRCFILAKPRALMTL
jgi:hypothetical protein